MSSYFLKVPKPPKVMPTAWTKHSSRDVCNTIISAGPEVYQKSIILYYDFIPCLTVSMSSPIVLVLLYDHLFHIEFQILLVTLNSPSYKPNIPAFFCLLGTYSEETVKGTIDLASFIIIDLKTLRRYQSEPQLPAGQPSRWTSCQVRGPLWGLHFPHSIPVGLWVCLWPEGMEVNFSLQKWSCFTL